MDRDEIIDFLKADNSREVFEHLHDDPTDKLMMYLRIDGSLAYMTVNKTAGKDTFTVILDIPRKFWSIHYIEWGELINRRSTANYPPV